MNTIVLRFALTRRRRTKYSSISLNNNEDDVKRLNFDKLTCDKILNGGNQRFAVTRGDNVGLGLQEKQLMSRNTLVLDFYQKVPIDHCIYKIKTFFVDKIDIFFL